jgi:hypothetical protein
MVVILCKIWHGVSKSVIWGLEYDVTLNELYVFFCITYILFWSIVFFFVTNEDALSKRSLLVSCNKRSTLFLSILLTSVCKCCLPLLYPLRFCLIASTTSCQRISVFSRCSIKRLSEPRCCVIYVSPSTNTDINKWGLILTKQISLYTRNYALVPATHNHKEIMKLNRFYQSSQMVSF